MQAAEFLDGGAGEAAEPRDQGAAEGESGEAGEGQQGEGRVGAEGKEEEGEDAEEEGYQEGEGEEGEWEEGEGEEAGPFEAEERTLPVDILTDEDVRPSCYRDVSRLWTPDY